MNTADTIAAISTVPAPAARLIVRLSGPLSHAVAGNLVHPIPTPVLRQAEEPDIGVVTSGSSAYLRTGVGMKFGAASAVHAMLCFNELRCPAWVYAFRSPHTYTGEDSIEFHLPGSLMLAKLLLDELYRQGVRAAEPGEFTARAFFNGKIGLTEAEGVAATIAAGSEMALRAARQLMAGELSRRLQPIMDSLAHTLALIEVGIDFSEEQVTFLASDQVLAKVLDADQALAELLSDSDRFEQVTHEPRIVFAGRPNAGKSSLINAMVRHHRAVVTDVSGTTRDVLTAELELKRGRVLLTDIAGLDSLTNGSGTTAEIADQMQSKAQNAIDSADHLIEISACTDASPRLDFGRPVDLRVITKSDLDPGGTASDARAIRVSSMTGAGLDRLRDALDELAFGESGGGASLALNRRHLLAISDARAALRRVPTGVSENSPELVAMDLRDALDALGSVVGSVTPDDVLGRIFSMFCIGK